jgi:hypothetical protein
MSSTGRSDVRQEDDFYETPAWAVRAVLPRLPPLGGRRILEPSAGRGAIVRVLVEAGAHPGDIVGVEIDSARAGSLLTIDKRIVACACSFETFASEYAVRGFDLIVMNPPFIHAEAHIRLARSLLAIGGTVAALCRLAFLAEGMRRATFRRDHPHDRVELTRRPSFVGGKTDSCAYAWGLFGEGRGGRFWTHEEP